MPKNFHIKVRAPFAVGLIYLIRALAGFTHSYELAAQRFRTARPNNPEDLKHIAQFQDLSRTVRGASLEKLAAQSTSFTNFLHLAEAYLSPSEYLRLLPILQHFAPLYLKIIWKPLAPWLKGQPHRILQDTKRYSFAGKLDAVTRVFDTEWPYTQPITLALVPLPEPHEGESNRSSGSASGLVSFMEYRKDLTEKPGHYMSVAFHEMAHMLFHNMSHNLELQLSEWFCKYGGNVPLHLLNEGLCTAISCGWLETEILGHLPELPWYGYEYLDGYGRVLWPIVEQYIKAGRRLDEQFAQAATAAFENRFPGASLKPELVLWNTLVIESTDKGFAHEMEGLLQWGNYRYTSSPLASEQSQDFFHKTKQLTAVFAVRSPDLPVLQEKYLPNLDISHQQNISCHRVDGRWVIVLIGETLEEQITALKQFLGRATVED